jgi:hypothetical protein
LINAAKAGIFVSMSNGNSGPGLGTPDHPSPDYINVAPSSTNGTFAAGRFYASAPNPVESTLQHIAYLEALFGNNFPLGVRNPFLYKSSASLDGGTNVEGCNPWPAGTFNGYAAVIKRGSCHFSYKVLNAQAAGAPFVIIYNSPAGTAGCSNCGDFLISMGTGGVSNQVTIPSIFIGNTAGVGLVNWLTLHPTDAELTLDNIAYQYGNTPDIIPDFSSRGPGVGDVLKPDIAAPGVNILAQGYDPMATGEAIHLGWGMSSGSSMAAPHVAGAAALLKQIHPTWSNAYIKSALMSTSNYLSVWNYDGSHAQPLDMGAGRLDLTHAADPGIILDPPSLGFGTVPTGTITSLKVNLTNVATGTENYSLNAIRVGGIYSTTVTSPLPGIGVTPSRISTTPGATASITVTLDTSHAKIGDNQGYLVLEGSAHQAHLPIWGRVMSASSGKDVLIIQNDGSATLGNSNYLNYYTDTLDQLGLTYDVWNADAHNGNPTTIPEPAVLYNYPVLIYFTGDYWQPNGSFSVSTPLTQLDMDRMTEYANHGGIVIAMGQDLASVWYANQHYTPSNNLNLPFVYQDVLGGNWMQDSLTHELLPSLPVNPSAGAPPAFQSISLNLGAPSPQCVNLSSANVVPPVTNSLTGQACFAYQTISRTLAYSVTISNPSAGPVTITASDIHSGTIGMNGPPVFDLWNGSDIISATHSLEFTGTLTLTHQQQSTLLDQGFFIDAHSNTHPDGAIRSQVSAAMSGAANQLYIDEIESQPYYDPNPPPGWIHPYTPILEYAGAYNLADGTVAMAHRAQPSLEYPGVSYFGRSIYTTFGLEGINDGAGNTSRQVFLGALLDWAHDKPSASISDNTVPNPGKLSSFEASIFSNISGTTAVSFRWDFGDGSAFTSFNPLPTVNHLYQNCGIHIVRVEAVDTWGNHAIGQHQLLITQCTQGGVLFLPLVSRK